jgi:hypothetical protein
VPNYEMAQPGHSYSEGGIDLSWPLGREESDVVSVPTKDQTFRFKQRILSGLIVESKRRPTKDEDTDVREYKLLTGEEAAAVKAEPAAAVTRTAYDPDTGGTVEIEIMGPAITDAALEAARAFEREQAAAAKAAEDDTTVTEEVALMSDEATAEHPGAVAGDNS